MELFYCRARLCSYASNDVILETEIKENTRYVKLFNLVDNSVRLLLYIYTISVYICERNCCKINCEMISVRRFSPSLVNSAAKGLKETDTVERIRYSVTQRFHNNRESLKKCC